VRHAELLVLPDVPPLIWSVLLVVKLLMFNFSIFSFCFFITFFNWLLVIYLLVHDLVKWLPINFEFFEMKCNKFAEVSCFYLVGSKYSMW